jgi:DNA-binding NarL/FixJ family response regulator
MPSRSRHKALQLLLVDDHAVVRSGLANMLSAQPGLTVLADAGDGETALRLAREMSPDVVLLDLVMPGMQGIECLVRLKADCPETKVLMLTSSDIGSDVRAAINAGADGYVTKTVSSAELIESIHTVARGERFVSAEVKRLLDEHASAIQLTPRELEVLQLLRKGMSNPDIGSILGITPRTAKAHVAALLVKLKAHDRAEAVARGFEWGLLRPSGY